MRKLITVLITLMVLTIFTVGCVSAEDVTDVEVPTEEIDVDDAVVETDEIEEVSESESGVLTYDVDENTTIQELQEYITGHDGFTLNFSERDYDIYSLNISGKTDITFNGNGATLNAKGASHILNFTNCNNIIIAGFKFNVNDTTNKYSAIYGSYVDNGHIYNNTMYNGANGVNINKHYSNLTIENNTAYNMSWDGISLANPNTFNTISGIGYTYINNNRIYTTTYAIFLGGLFNGEIKRNTITSSYYGMYFQGKPNGNISAVVADISYNTITNINADAIHMENITVDSLNITYNNLYYNTAGVGIVNSNLSGLNIANNDIYNSSFAIYVLGGDDGNSIDGSILSNTIEDVVAGIYLENMSITSLNIEDNEIRDATAGIYTENMNISGLTIYDNLITNSYYGIRFVGESSGNTISTTISYNDIVYVTVGIYLENMTAVNLNIYHNYIDVTQRHEDYIISVVNFSKSSGGYITVTYNTFYGCIDVPTVWNLVNVKDPNYGTVTWIN